MAIKIIPEPDIHITQAGLERLRPEWEASQRMTVRPVSFETWLRQRRDRAGPPTPAAVRVSVVEAARRYGRRL